MKKTEDKSKSAPLAFNRIKHPKQRAFLSVYAETSNIVKAARSAQINRGTHYHWLDSDPDYARAFDMARRQSGDILESEAMRRAVEGTEEYVLHQGQPVRDPDNPGQFLKKRRYSDFLLFKMMQAAIPEKYRENFVPQGADEDDGVRVAGRSRMDVIREEIAARQAALEMLERGYQTSLGN